MSGGIKVATTDADWTAAVAVWERAKKATGAAPGDARRTRVREKVSDEAALVLLAVHNAATRGMALAEPFRSDGGAAPVLDGWGHISMVFVDPEVWGRGLGRRLLIALQSCPERWTRLSLWTRLDNDRARRLYAGVGFVDAGDRAALAGGEPIMRLQW